MNRRSRRERGACAHRRRRNEQPPAHPCIAVVVAPCGEVQRVAPAWHAWRHNRLEARSNDHSVVHSRDCRELPSRTIPQCERRWGRHRRGSHRRVLLWLPPEQQATVTLLLHHHGCPLTVVRRLVSACILLRGRAPACKRQSAVSAAILRDAGLNDFLPRLLGAEHGSRRPKGRQRFQVVLRRVRYCLNALASVALLRLRAKFLSPNSFVLWLL